MCLNPDQADFPASGARAGLSACLSALAILVLGACSSRPPVVPSGSQIPLKNAQPATAASASASASASAAAPSAARPGLAPLPAPGNAAPASAAAPAHSILSNSAPASLGTAAPPAEVPISLPPADTVVGLLAYADRVRALPAPELFREIARLGSPATPAEQLQLALLLSQLHQAAELARAQELLNRILSNPSAPAQPLQPLARLLATRYADQHRLEDQLEKQIQQTRDVQRRLDQTRERLEALKAIERSLTSRPPAAAASAPASRRNHPAAP